jgi:hypothetical protein
MKNLMVRICVLAIVLFMSGCAELANSPMLIDQLKIRSEVPDSPDAPSMQT